MATNLLHFFRNLDYGQLLRGGIDIFVVAFVLYRLILLAKGRRAWQILLGMLVFFFLVFLSERLGLVTFNWLLRQVTPLGPVAVVILLYPELRDLLERMGRFDFWGAPLPVSHRGRMDETIDAVVRAAMLLAPRKIGALIVLERETGLEDIVATGIALHAEVTTELLATIFHVGTPLHDGAVIIRGERVVAAGCTLPLSDSPNIATNVHMRHRAAIGVSEASDAVAVVVSEERGTVSVAVGGKLIPGFKADTLRDKLGELFGRRELWRDRAANLPLSLHFGHRRAGAVTPPPVSATAKPVTEERG